MPSGFAVAVNGTVDEELGQSSRIEVYERMGQPTSFRIRYELEVLDGDFPWLVDERLGPGSELQVLVGAGNVEDCLVKGPVHAQRAHIEHRGKSWLEVEGTDSSISLDREVRSVLWSDTTDGDTAGSIIQRYGYTSDVESTRGDHQEDKHALVQRESDLQFLRRLARRNGYLFWVTSDPKGIETAHFRPPQTSAEPVVSLVINLGTPNFAAFDLQWDIERPTQVEGAQLDLNSLSNLGGTRNTYPGTTLGTTSMAAASNVVRSTLLSAPIDADAEISARSDGLLLESAWFIRAQCEVIAKNVPSFVRAHSVIEIHGLGSRHSGRYFVGAVTHTIDSTQHKMQLELLRNGWGA